MQQIVSLKCFGFNLPEIKELQKANIGSKRQFELQAIALEEKAMKLMDARHALKAIISEVTENELAPWETLLKLMEVYRVTEKLTQKWVTEILPSD